MGHVREFVVVKFSETLTYLVMYFIATNKYVVEYAFIHIPRCTIIPTNK